MNIHKKDKRGVTLVELCITMAILAILTTSVISFCILVNNHVNRIAESSSITEDLSLFNTSFNAWCSKFDSDKYIISVNDSSCLHASSIDNPKTVYKFYLSSDSKIIGELPSGREISIKLSSLSKLKFVVHKSNDHLGILMECNLTYLKTPLANEIKQEKNSTFYFAFRACKGGE